MSQKRSFDPIWEEEIYSQRSPTRYPYDSVVTFVFRNYPRDKTRQDVHILEVGCGGGNNLWFAAREGFQVTGLDGSAKAIDYARKRFAEEDLPGTFYVGDFTALPFEDDSFDLVIDRGAITCTGLVSGQQAILEIHRVLHVGGRFFFNPYSKEHTSAASGTPGADSTRINIQDGSLVGFGQLCFYDRNDVESVLGAGWQILKLEHKSIVDYAAAKPEIHAEWQVVVEKSK